MEKPFSGALRDIPPTAIRLAPEVKHALAREAAINNRSLHAEIVMRLKASIGDADAQQGMAQSMAMQRMPGQLLPQALPDAERQMLAVFRSMSPEKQLALLSLFK